MLKLGVFRALIVPPDVLEVAESSPHLPEIIYIPSAIQQTKTLGGDEALLFLYITYRNV